MRLEPATSMALINKCLSYSRLCGTVFPAFSRLSPVSGNTQRGIFTYPKPKPDWDKAVSEAEKIVGYPPSFANLRWLLSDEIANVAIHLRKLVGSNHPILKTAKHLLYNDKNNTQAWGLLILLVSKAAGIHESYEVDPEGGVLQDQRMMAEVVEMIRTGHLVHKGLINFAAQEYSDNRSNLNFGNKIALLTGDYLLVTANGMLSKLRNQHLSELISSALRDLSDSEFIGERDPQNIPIPSKPDLLTKVSTVINDDAKVKEIIGYGRKFEPLDHTGCIGTPVREWTLRNTLDGGSLLGVGCQGVLHLAGHDQKFQDSGYLFGCHAALAWQASHDYGIFTSQKPDTYSLVCAPVLFAIHENNAIMDKLACSKDGVNKVNYDDLSSDVRATSALDNTVRLFHEHYNAANRILDDFPDSRATDALRNIILALSVY